MRAITQPAAADANFVSGLAEKSILAQFFSEFLDEQSFGEFRQIERLIATLKQQGLTRAGYPIIRPADCGRITTQLAAIFKKGRPHFRTREQQLIIRFEALISDFHDFCRRMYPGEAMSARILHARVLLLMGDADGVLELLAPYARRPYVFEDNAKQFFDLIRLYARAHLMRGTLDEVDMSFIALGRWAPVNVRGMTSIIAGIRMAPFVSFGKQDTAAPVRSALIRLFSRIYVSCSTKRSNPRSYIAAKVGLALSAVMLGMLYALLSDGGKTGDPFSLRRNRDGGVLVARAMGGIGDLLMMEPGLEVNAKRYGQPVDFAIPRKFFPIFSHNPQVNLIDIDGPPIDISAYRHFFNLSQCPASRYESPRAPHIKKGRVETFALGMGVGRRALLRQGWRINHFLSNDEEAFCDAFLQENGIGSVGGSGRRLVGVQPYSRDSYKDHPGIAEIIRAIAKDHDVLIFHHVANGLPEGERIITTAGLPLGQSLALVSRLDAMVSVDSAFLHAASAFDVPVVGLFGPTDPRTLTRHHRRVKNLWRQDSLACVPCWRNEDRACAVTGLLSVSPCMAGIRTDEVLAALDDMLKA